MQRCRVLVVNDFAQSGGAEVVYRQSAELLSAMPDVEVECFDESRFHAGSPVLSKIWNPTAARALRKAIVGYRPHRILVHNYHNALSPSVLGVITQYKGELGYATYLTCHDYYLVYYNASLQYYPQGRVEILPLDILQTRQALTLRASANGLVYDVLKKAYWHAMRMAYRPERVFDRILCPSTFMQEALHRVGIDNTVILSNPSALSEPLAPLTVRDRERFNLAFVGRVVHEKGLASFIELAQSTDFSHTQCIGVYGDGPDREALEQRFASLVASGKLAFHGMVPQDRLFSELRRSADAIVLPSLAAENAPLVVIDAAMLGLPALVREGGSLSTFGDSVGNKIMYRSGDPESLRAALDELAAHLSKSGRRYDVSEHLPHHYAERLAQIMQIGGQQVRPVGPRLGEYTFR